MHAVWIKFFNLVYVFVLKVLHQTFPQHTFLMNGLIHGVKVSIPKWNLYDTCTLKLKTCLNLCFLVFVCFGGFFVVFLRFDFVVFAECVFSCLVTPCLMLFHWLGNKCKLSSNHSSLSNYQQNPSLLAPFNAEVLHCTSKVLFRENKEFLKKAHISYFLVMAILLLTKMLVLSDQEIITVWTNRHCKVNMI